MRQSKVGTVPESRSDLDLESLMAVMVVYIVLVAVGEVIGFFIGSAIDRMVPASWSMIAYMAVFFGVIFGMWPVAVRITEKYLVSAESTPAAE
jgi:hypothetical protein